MSMIVLTARVYQGTGECDQCGNGESGISFSTGTRLWSPPGPHDPTKRKPRLCWTCYNRMYGVPADGVTA